MFLKKKFWSFYLCGMVFVISYFFCFNFFEIFFFLIGCQFWSSFCSGIRRIEDTNRAQLPPCPSFVLLPCPPNTELLLPFPAAQCTGDRRRPTTHLRRTCPAATLATDSQKVRSSRRVRGVTRAAVASTVVPRPTGDRQTTTGRILRRRPARQTGNLPPPLPVRCKSGLTVVVSVFRSGN